MAPVMQVLAVGRTKHRTAAGREHAACERSQLVDHRFLDIAEAALPFAVEIVADRAAQAFLDDVVGVEKGQLQAPGELPPDGGFTGAGEADEGDQETTALLGYKNQDAFAYFTVTV